MPNKIAESLISIIPVKDREMVGSLMAICLFTLTPILFVMAMLILLNFADSLKGKCWSLEEIKNETYKVNSCNGDVEKLDLSPANGRQ